jgi:hypothetical protein
MTQPVDPQAWIQTFQALLHHYLPPLENTPTANAVALTALVAGLFLVVRAAKYERGIVATAALFVGAWIGYRVALLVDTPQPISAAIGAVALAAVAYHSYRWWLAAGSVVVLFFLAIIFQLGRGDLQRYLPTPEETRLAAQDAPVVLVSQAEQLKNLHPDRADQLAKIGERIKAELNSIGPTGWIVPFAAAIIGGFLAWWALRLFAVLWLGFLGAVIAVLGACGFAVAHWPRFHADLVARPDIAAWTVVGIWVLGLIWQAKEARFPKRKPAEAAKEAAKT